MEPKLLDKAMDPERNYMNQFPVDWVYVYGYEGDYAVSSIGDVFSFKSNKRLKPRISGNTKYWKVDLYKDGKRKTVAIHQIVWESFYEQQMPAGFQIDHIDGHRDNNQLSNLQCLSINDHQLKHKEIQVTVLYRSYPYRKDFTNEYQLQQFGFSLKQVENYIAYNDGYDPFKHYYFMKRA